jgi:RNA recognition motif-containing protein
MQTKLFVKNLGSNVTSEDIMTLFSGHGEVKESKIIDGRGIGFVEMSNQMEAESARKALDGNDFKGRKLKIEIAQPSKGRSRAKRYR